MSDEPKDPDDEHGPLKKLLERSNQAPPPPAPQVAPRGLMKTTGDDVLCSICGKKCKLIQCWTKDPYYKCPRNHESTDKPRHLQLVEPMSDDDLRRQLGKDPPDGDRTQEPE